MQPATEPKQKSSMVVRYQLSKVTRTAGFDAALQRPRLAKFVAANAKGLSPPEQEQTIGQILYDADFVGNVQRIVVRGQSHVSLLLSVRTNQRIHFACPHVVELRHGLPDLSFIRSNINNKD
jgi:hypothetical protein